MLRKMIYFGETKVAKILNIVFYTTILIALISLGFPFVFKTAPKFYSAIFFNFLMATITLHFFVVYVDENKYYRDLRDKLKKSGVDEKVIDEYIKNLKDWRTVRDWLIFIVLAILIMWFVYWLIP